MRRPGAAIVMALAIGMVPWGGSAMTIIATTMTTTTTTTTAGNAAGAVAGKQGGLAGACSGKIKEQQ